MSRAAYSDDLENWDLIRWRGRVASAIRGKRGQRLLRDLVVALEAMPDKRLIAEELLKDGEVCALGAVARLRALEKIEEIDPEDPDQVAARLDIAEPLAREVVYMNDEWEHNETPEHRYQRMLRWAKSHIAEPA